MVDHLTLDNAFVAVADNHGVLQRWLTAGELWAGIDSITAIRLVSIAAGAVTIAAVAAIARRFSRRASIFAAFAAALMPALVVHSAVGIADPLAVAAVAVAVLMLVRLAEAPTTRNIVLVALVACLALLVKKTALVVAVLLPVSWLVWRRAGARAGRRWLAGVAAAVAGLVSAWLILKLAPAPFEAVARQYGRLEYLSPVQVLRHFPGELSHAFPDFGGDLVAYATVPLLLAAALGLVVAIRERPDLAALLAVWAVVPFAVAVFSAKIAYPRFVLASYPPLALLAGVGLAALAPLLAAVPRGRFAATALALGAFIPAVVFDVGVVRAPKTFDYPGIDEQQYVSGFAAGPVWPELATALERAATRQGKRSYTIAWGGRGVGPIGLAAQVGRPLLAEGTVNAGYFSAAADGRTYRFVPHAAVRGTDFVVAQDVDTVPLPGEVVRDYVPLARASRPHDGSSVALLARR